MTKQMQVVEKEAELTQGQQDNFAIWAAPYSTFWFSDVDYFEEEHPADIGCCEVPQNYKKDPDWFRRGQFDFQRDLPKWNFAVAFAEMLMVKFDRPENENAEHCPKYEQFFITRKNGAKVIVFSRSQINKVFEERGIKGVYALVLLAFAQMEAGMTGIQSKKMNAKIHDSIEKSAKRMPFRVALNSLVKPIDRMCWGENRS